MDPICDKEVSLFTHSELISFGLKVKSLRIGKGFSQIDLAYKMNTSPCKISNIETGFCQNITFKTILKLAKALGIHYQVFFIEIKDEEEKIEE